MGGAQSIGMRGILVKTGTLVFFIIKPLTLAVGLLLVVVLFIYVSENTNQHFRPGLGT